MTPDSCRKTCLQKIMFYIVIVIIIITSNTSSSSHLATSTNMFLFSPLTIVPIPPQHLNSNQSGVNASADERHVTKMCFWIAIVYTFCWSPFLIVQLSGILGNYSEVYFNLHACSSGVGVIGSAINPIVYAVMDPYYRSVLLPCNQAKKNKVDSEITKDNSTACAVA